MQHVHFFSEQQLVQAACGPATLFEQPAVDLHALGAATSPALIKKALKSIRDRAQEVVDAGSCAQSSNKQRSSHI